MQWQLLIFSWLPESPRMLVAWGQKDAAEKTLAQLRSARGPRDAERVALELEASRLRLMIQSNI